MAVKIFYCYAHEDESLLKKLQAHLRPLQRKGLIDAWHDRDISAGSNWEQEISEHLNAAQIILLLVSPDFMDSDYCYGTEMKRAIERHERKEARVIPVILRPIYWRGTLGELQALPTDAIPVMNSKWHNLDEAFFDIAEGIRKVIQQVLVIKALESPKFEWRTIKGVSDETKLSRREVQQIINELGEQVIISRVPDRNGNSLYTTQKHYEATLNISSEN